MSLSTISSKHKPLSSLFVAGGGGGGGGLLPEKLGGGVRPASQNSYPQFMTKICDFCYPIYDLTKNSINFI